MSRDDHNYDDFTIVPDRDDLDSRSGKKRGNSIVTAPPSTPAGIGGGVRFLLGLLVLGLFASAGGGYYFHMQGQQTMADLAASAERIRQLENRLRMVDESVEQSSMGLLERVDFNFSEIDKLWAARNVLRNDVAQINNTLSTHTENIAAFETAISNQAGRINQQTASLEQQVSQLNAVQERLQALRQEMPDGAALNQQLTRMNQDLEVLKASVTNEGSDLASRVQMAQQDIEAINVFRLQLNQTIAAMRNDINALQERLATTQTSF